MIACVSVNDPFVMAAWGESSGAEGKIRMLADTTAEFTKVLTASPSVPINPRVGLLVSCLIV